MRDPRRRDLLRGSAALAAVTLVGCAKEPAAPEPSAPARRPSSDATRPPPTEDLMREHGLVARLLLVYDEAARRLESNGDLRADVLPRAARFARAFVHDYHERLEQDHVFPVFEQALNHVDLVRVLREQHAVGRKITAMIEQGASNGPPAKRDERKHLAAILRAFTHMYRAHSAREDTVLFPDFRGLVGGAELAELGERFARVERDAFGDAGFEREVEEIDQLELALDVHDLAQATADVR